MYMGVAPTKHVHSWRHQLRWHREEDAPSSAGALSWSASDSWDQSGWASKQWKLRTTHLWLGNAGSAERLLELNCWDWNSLCQEVCSAFLLWSSYPSLHCHMQPRCPQESLGQYYFWWGRQKSLGHQIQIMPQWTGQCWSPGARFDCAGGVILARFIAAKVVGRGRPDLQSWW